MTLTIIGVVAAMSVPSIISNTQNSTSVQKLKKFYSNLFDAYKFYIVDNGDITSSGVFSSDAEIWDNFIKPNFSFAKDCGTSSGCWPVGLNAYRYLNGDSINQDLGIQNIGKGVLADGTLIRAWIRSSNCSFDESVSGSGTLASVCGFIGIDVNGVKKPNQLGRDYFGFWITKTGVYPLGALDDRWVGCDPSSNDVDKGANLAPGNGQDCTAKVIQEGAMDY